MKNIFKRFVPMVLCAALLTGSSAFAVPKATPINQMSVAHHGSITKLDDGRIKVTNNNTDATYKEVILNVDNAYILDATTGMPVTLESVKENSTVYAFANTYMALSDPPQGGAQLVLCNIPADYKVPMFYEVVKNTSADGVTTIETDYGNNIVINKNTSLTPYLTKQMVYADGLRVGERLLVWSEADGVATKVIVFPYKYSGHVALLENGTIAVNGTAISQKTVEADGIVMVPVRQVAEALDFTVEWDNPTKTVTIIQNAKQKKVLEAKIGGAEGLDGDNITVKLAAPLKTVGESTYIALNDVEVWLRGKIVK